MTKGSPQPYVLHNDNEVERLERQAVIAGFEDHLRHLSAPAHAMILDAGCGSGSMSRLLARQRQDATVIGVDLNRDYLAGARALAAGLANLSFREGDLQDLPFQDASFDLIWTKYVLYFLPDPSAALAEFCRVLRPGGSVVVALNDWSGIVLDPPDEALHRTLQVVVGKLIDRCLPKKLLSALRKAGFALVSVELETDRVYTSFGAMTPEQRDNHLVELLATRPYVAETLGGDAAFEAWVADWFAYLDDPDTNVMLPMWFVRGTVAS